MKQKVIHDKVDISLVLPNEGQINDIPQNPRRIDKEKFKELCKSIKALPELTEAREIIVYPLNGNYIALGGNMRLNAYSELGWEKVPVCILPEDMPTKKLREIVIQDNNSFGETDWDMIANEWDMEELDDWGFDVWQEPKKKSKDPKKDEEEEDENADYYAMMLGDRIYDSNNEFDIPNLKIDGQPKSGLLLPFSRWGSDKRAKKGISTYHFYVEDYRFEAIWKNPNEVLNSGCTDLVEPNLSLFDTTPIAYGLQQIYKKRWIARYWQECGANIYADLNVSRKFQKYNRLGIPDGYNAFFVRGYADREEYLKEEIQIAREISGKDIPNIMVYGGGDKIKELCILNNVIYVEQFMANRVNKGGKNGENKRWG